jgi:2-dehydro-3-deoxyphosphogluconate aldolase/(4S)-4-hydroxy-2-oxoglutarate aldolase
VSDDAYTTMTADRVVAVVRARTVPDPVALCRTLADAGVRCVEFTFTIPDAVGAIEVAASSGVVVVGAGTVLEPDQAARAIDAGARFIVSPAVRPGLGDVCARTGVPLMLGALTPTEVLAALDGGSRAVKLFPAGLGGPSYLKDLRGPFPEVAFVPSGGVDANNARAFLDAGAVAVYAGSSVTAADLVERGDLDEIGRRAAALVAAIAG